MSELAATTEATFDPVFRDLANLVMSHLDAGATSEKNYPEQHLTVTSKEYEIDTLSELGAIANRVVLKKTLQISPLIGKQKNKDDCYVEDDGYVVELRDTDGDKDYSVLEIDLRYDPRTKQDYVSKKEEMGYVRMQDTTEAKEVVAELSNLSEQDRLKPIAG